MNKYLLSGLLMVIVLGGAYLASLTSGRTDGPVPLNNDRSGEETPAPTSELEFTLPTEGFLGRITLKPFGIFIDPKTSPVQPENFSGYHTAADAEYGDVAGDVVVNSIAAGKVVISRTAQGYGGVIVIDHRPTYDFYSLYGHVEPSTIPKVGTEISKGQHIGILAPAYSVGSGGERKHLHLGIVKSGQPTIAGYVAKRGQLSAWMDPVELWK